ncbi:MAG TPA: sigma-70 family RNA polymerase sigma factor [Planctomycetota bacterium]|nr:sigma-70 family RNA polymerase sigma factor [Planctomycetota bacterium]
MGFITTVWALLSRARERDGPAMEEVARTYGEPVRDYFRRIGLDAEADDLAQEVLLRACRTEFLERARPEKGRFRTLLHTLIRNVLADWRRREEALRRRASGEALPLDQIREPMDPGREIFERLWIAHLTRTALGGLEREIPAQARALRWHYLEGCSYADIAARLGRGENDVRNLLFHARRNLKAHLADLIRAGCRNPEDYRDELRELVGFADDGRGR